MAFIEQFYTWATGNTITAARLNGNISAIIDGLDGGTKDINISKLQIAGNDVIDSSENITITGDITGTSSTTAKPLWTLKNTNADATSPELQFYKLSASPADDDDLGRITFYGDDDGTNKTLYAQFVAESTDVTDTTEDGKLTIYTTKAGTSTASITIASGDTDFGANNVTTGGILKIDVDGTAENAAGSLTMGAGNDAGIFFDGTDLVIITNGAGASGIILDSEDDTVEIKGSGTLQATFDISGLNLASGDGYSIAGTSVLNATTLGTGVVASSLTSLGTLTSLNVSGLSTLTKDDSGVGVEILRVNRTSDSPADNDYSSIFFYSENDNNEQEDFCELRSVSLDVSDGTEKGQYNFLVADGVDGSMDSVATLDIDSFSLNTIFEKKTESGITASTTQSQGQQTLTSDINEISTVSNTKDVVTLPDASSGRIIRVVNNGSNILQVYPSSGDNIGKGVDTSDFLDQGEIGIFIAYDSTNWEFQRVQTEYRSFTPTISGLGTVSSNSAFYKRSGNTMHVHGSFVSGTPAASEFQLGLPSGFEVNSSVISVTYSGGMFENTSSQIDVILLATPGDSYMNGGKLQSGVNTNPLTIQNGNNIVNGTNKLTYSYTVMVEFS